MSNSFKKYDTRSASNTGVQLFVIGPDGKITTDWLTVRGLDSDAFQAAAAEMRRALLQYISDNGGHKAATEKPEYKQVVKQQELRMKASLVGGWSFEEECTVDNVIALFECAPYIGAQVDDESGKRERFATNWQSVSEPTQPQNSSSLPLSQTEAEPPEGKP